MECADELGLSPDDVEGIGFWISDIFRGDETTSVAQAVACGVEAKNVVGELQRKQTFRAHSSDGPIASTQSRIPLARIHVGNSVLAASTPIERFWAGVNWKEEPGMSSEPTVEEAEAWRPKDTKSSARWMAP